jgi:hypothetical protein
MGETFVVFREVSCENVNYIKKAHGIFQWSAVIAIVFNLQVQYYGFLEELNNYCLPVEEPLLFDISNESGTGILLYSVR